MNVREQLKEILNDSNVISIYDYGSSVYGTMTEKSDIDIIMVVNDKIKAETLLLKMKQYVDVNMFDKEEFKRLIEEHEVTALECIFLDNKYKWKEVESWNFTLNLQKLRNAFSSKSSNSWVKAKKKFVVEKDFNDYIGKKSAWHAIRILDFGQQIGEKGCIYNYSRVNNILKEIMQCNTWEEIDKQFRKTYNEAGTKFKLVAPKEVKEIPIKLKL